MGGSEKTAEAEKETAEVLRKIDAHAAIPAAAKRRSDSPVDPRPTIVDWRVRPTFGSAAVSLAATRAATIRGFVWGALSVAVLGGIAWFVSEKATPRRTT